jgi:hypothetical protein
MYLSDSHHFRKLVAGVCMVVAPILALVSFVISPQFETEAAAQLGRAADDLDRYYASNLIGMITLVLLVPAVLGLMHMLRERRAAYGHVGGALALIGVFASMVSIGIGFAVWRMAHGGVTPAEVGVLDDLNNVAGVVLPVYILGFGVGLGFIVLAAGLYLAKAVDWWMAALVALGPVLINISFVAGELAFAIVGAALLVVGLGSVGLMVLRETDADWEHTPEYQGLRPAPRAG